MVNHFFVIISIEGVGGMTNSLYDKSDKIKKVRDEYERKISDMQKELRKLQSAQKEHTRQQRELQSQESQLRTLKNELFEMKSAKVCSNKLPSQMFSFFIFYFIIIRCRSN